MVLSVVLFLHQVRPSVVSVLFFHRLRWSIAQEIWIEAQLRISAWIDHAFLLLSFLRMAQERRSERRVTVTMTSKSSYLKMSDSKIELSCSSRKRSSTSQLMLPPSHLTNSNRSGLRSPIVHMILMHRRWTFRKRSSSPPRQWASHQEQVLTTLSAKKSSKESSRISPPKVTTSPASHSSTSFSSRPVLLFLSLSLYAFVFIFSCHFCRCEPRWHYFFEDRSVQNRERMYLSGGWRWSAKAAVLQRSSPAWRDVSMIKRRDSLIFFSPSTWDNVNREENVKINSFARWWISRTRQDERESHFILFGIEYRRERGEDRKREKNEKRSIMFTSPACAGWTMNRSPNPQLILSLPLFISIHRKCFSHSQSAATLHHSSLFLSWIFSCCFVRSTCDTTLDFLSPSFFSSFSARRDE